MQVTINDKQLSDEQVEHLGKALMDYLLVLDQLLAEGCIEKSGAEKRIAILTEIYSEWSQDSMDAIKGFVDVLNVLNSA